ncbi:MAG: hypothetical protein ACP5PB_00475 [Acidimicrobiales bacterium]
MARSRARRRRYSVLLVVAVILTVLVLGFAEDVSRAAHQAVGPRRSENRSFAQLANDLVGQENLLDARFVYLVTHGESLSRPVFAGRLTQLADQLPQWSTEAQLLRRPILAHHVNRTIAQVTESLVDGYTALFATVAHALTLPWPPSTTATSGAVSGSLLAAAKEWNVARWSLIHEPGTVTLDALDTATARLNLPATLAALAASPTLTLRRAVSVAALQVLPAPLPSSVGRLLLPPTGELHLGVVARNEAYVVQPCVVSVSLAAGAAPAQRDATRLTLGPLGSYAWVPTPLRVHAGEHATLTVRVSGTDGGGTATRTYAVVVAPTVTPAG